MADFDLALRSRRALLSDGERDAVVLVRDGRIAGIASPSELSRDTRIDDVGDALLMPGLVDCHVHVNEPGRTEWEGFESATRAAAAGGITSIVDMPLNSSPVTTTAAALALKRDAARGRVNVDCGFWGGVVPGNAAELRPMAESGARGFKAFLVHSGIDDFPAAREADLRAALPILAERGVPLLAHAELELPTGAGPEGADPRLYETYLRSRPRAWENEAIRLLVRLCRETGARIHVVHLSSSDALGDLRAARAEGLPITAETCPHYLTFTAEQVPDGATEFKCAPPVREKANREALWEGLRDGTLDFVVSDHSPCTPSLKARESGDFMQAWGGISSLQVVLPALWTEARRRGFRPADVARWTSRATADFAGLGRSKGRLAVGLDADFVVWQPEREWRVEPARLHHRHKLTPYAGRTLLGVVEATYLRGRKVYDRGTLAPEPAGRLL
jgi:allantoinase